MVRLYKLNAIIFFNEEEKGLSASTTFTPLHIHAEVIEELELSDKEAAALLSKPQQQKKDFIGISKGQGPERAVVAYQAGTVTSLTESPDGKVGLPEVLKYNHKGLGGTAHFEEEVHKAGKHLPIRGMGRGNKPHVVAHNKEFLFWDGYKREDIKGKKVPTPKYSVTTGGDGMGDIVAMFKKTLGSEVVGIAHGTLYVTEDTAGRVFCGADNLQQALKEQKKYGGEYQDKMEVGHVYHILELGDFLAKDLKLFPVDALYLRDVSKDAKVPANYHLAYCSDRMPEGMHSKVVSTGADGSKHAVVAEVNKGNTVTGTNSHVKRLRDPAKNDAAAFIRK